MSERSCHNMLDTDTDTDTEFYYTLAAIRGKLCWRLFDSK